jgi:hypothetical protein
MMMIMEVKKSSEIHVSENITLEDFLKGLTKNLDENTAIIQEEIKMLTEKLTLIEDEVKKLKGERKIELIK